MQYQDFLADLRAKTEKISDIERTIRTLKARKAEQDREVENELAAMAVAFVRTAGFDLTRHDPQRILGAFRQAVERLDGKRHDGQLMKAGEELLDQFIETLAKVKSGAAHAGEKAIDSDLVIDPQETKPTNLLVVLQKNPVGYANGGDESAGQSVGDQIDALAQRLRLKRYTHVNQRNPVCVLVGEARPIDLADLIESHDGVLLRNASDGRFRGPTPPQASSSETDRDVVTASEPSNGTHDQQKALPRFAIEADMPDDDHVDDETDHVPLALLDVDDPTPDDAPDEAQSSARSVLQRRSWSAEDLPDVASRTHEQHGHGADQARHSAKTSTSPDDEVSASRKEDLSS